MVGSRQDRGVEHQKVEDTEDSSLSLEPNLSSNHLFVLAMKPSQKRRCKPNGSPNTKFSRHWEGQFWCKGNHGLREDIGQEDGELKLGHGCNVVDFRAPTVKGIYPRPAHFPSTKPLPGKVQMSLSGLGAYGFYRARAGRGFPLNSITRVSPWMHSP